MATDTTETDSLETSSKLADGRIKSPDHHLGVESIAESKSWTKPLESKFGSLLPKNLSENERDRALSGIGVALYVQNFDSDRIAADIEKARVALIEQRGPDIAPKADRMAVLGYARQARASAAEYDPLSQIDPAIKSEYLHAANHARSNLNWKPEQMREMAADLIVRNGGDHTKAAKSFIELVGTDLKVEAGMVTKESIDAEIDDGERKPRRVELVAPEHIPDSQRAMQEAESDRRTEKQLDRTDKIAAAVLAEREYVGYRVLRDNLNAVFARDDGKKLDGDSVDNTAGKLISDKLMISPANGRHMSAQIVEKLQTTREMPKLPSLPNESAESIIVRLGDYTSKANLRMYTPTEKLLETSNASRSKFDKTEMDARRERERMLSRERAARSYEAKKAAREAEKLKIDAPNIPSPAVIDAGRRRVKIDRSRDNGIEL